jgi:hypothetical protein
VCPRFPKMLCWIQKNVCWQDEEVKRFNGKLHIYLPNTLYNEL